MADAATTSLYIPASIAVLLPGLPSLTGAVVLDPVGPAIVAAPTRRDG